MNALIFSLYQQPLATLVAHQLNVPLGDYVFRCFPDNETYLKIESDVQDKTIIIIDSLDNPNHKILPLLFLSKLLKELGAKSLIFVAPYLCYLRQDKRFNSGEGISSLYFAELLSGYFDGLITIDPHLHRYHNLNEIYSIPTEVIHSSSVVSRWIIDHVANPILVGPDSESEQWVNALSKQIGIPCVILEKHRRGDEVVEVKVPNIANYQNAKPILIDDIISTGQTMLETIKQLKALLMPPPICIGTHAIFANDAYQQLLKANTDKIITCNTITHPSNLIDVSPLITKSLRGWFKG